MGISFIISIICFYSHGVFYQAPASDNFVNARTISHPVNWYSANFTLQKAVCFVAKVVLPGEIRKVERVEQRILKAEKLGLSTIYVSKYNKVSLKNTAIIIQLISRIEDLVSKLPYF